MRINFTIFRVLLGAGQVQYKGKEGREEVRKGGRKGINKKYTFQDLRSVTRVMR